MSTAIDADLRDIPVADPSSHTRQIDTLLIAALAAWLIFNSHMEHYYPIRFLAADGLLGNSLFFLLSGYGVQMSLLGRDQSLVGYAWRRAIRLYPAVIITIIAFELVIYGLWREYGPVDYVRRLIYPTRFTYVENIVPFYLVLYAFGRLRSPQAISTAIAVGIAGYLLGCMINSELSATHPVTRWAMYWIVLCFGALCAVQGWRSELTMGRGGALAVCLLVYYVARGFTIVTGRMEALTILADVLVTACCVLILLTLGSPPLVRKVLRIPVVGIFLAASGACTLEIFVLHATMVEFDWFTAIRFPLNILTLAAVTFVLAVSLHKLCEGIRRGLEPQKRMSHRA